jgi:signal transduction histidine kinase
MAMETRNEELDERVLVLAPLGRDGELACGALEGHGVRAFRCRSIHDAAREIARGAGVFLVADEALSAPALDVLVPALAAQPPWSDLPVVIISTQDSTATATQRTLGDFERFGHVMLLDRPVRIVSLVSAACAALRARRRQYEARDLLERLKDGVEHRDRFLAMLGHELRNPLAAIVYGASLLSKEGDQGPRALIDRQARHLSRLVDELLDVSRVTSGKIVLQRGVVDLRSLVERALESIRPATKAVTVDVQLSDGPLLVDVDAVRMEQVITNLLTNALKYTKGDGHVTVRADRDAAGVSLRVEDDGVGIPADMLPRIFDLFTQVDGSLDRARGGLGIGLTIVQAVVELHGGTVHVASEGINRGTRFDVHLPASNEAFAPPPPPAPAPLLSAPNDPRRVLVVEDDEDVREALQLLLEAEGFDVEVAAEGGTAVARAQATSPAAALVDIGLPGMSGYDVARAIRRDLGARIYLAALSGYGQPEDRARSSEAGFDAHLTKPVDIDTVTRLLRSASQR